MVTDGLNPLTVLAFLGGVLGGGALALAYAFARITGRQPLAKATLVVAGVGVGAYALLFGIASVSSRNRVLAPGEEKHICEIDCHLAYSVAGAKTEPSPAGGTRYIVTVKVRFDEETISPRRPKDASLSPNSRFVALVDAAGNVYSGSTVAFDVPAGAADVRLVLRNDDFETHFLIGHENSFLHGKTMFALHRET